MALSSPEFQDQPSATDVNAQPRPEIVFTLAALKAIDLQDINNAYRFSGMAIRADNAAKAKTASIPGLDLELKYLNAVTNRLLITTAGAHLRAPNRTNQENMLAAGRSIQEVTDAFNRASGTYR